MLASHNIPLLHIVVTHQHIASFGVVASVLEHDGNGSTVHLDAAWLQNKFDVVQAAWLQIHGFELAAMPFVDKQLSATKHIHLF